MYQLIVENKDKKRLELTNNPNYSIITADGIASLEAELFTSTFAFKDGSQFKNAKVSERALTLNIAILGSGFQTEQSRIALYDFFAPGQLCTIYYKNQSRNCYIHAYIESLEIDPFTNGQTAQVGLVATNPFWIDLYTSTIDISKKHGLFEFPFSIEESGKELTIVEPGRVAAIVNKGAKETGFIITVRCLMEGISNPVIYNYKTGEFIKINMVMKEGDIITINTIDKKISLMRNLQTTNIIAYKSADSNWLTLSPGVNLFTYEADANSEYLQVITEHNTLYIGV